MLVKLISKNSDILETMYTAAHNCYSDRKPEEIMLDGPVLTEKETNDIYAKSANAGEFLTNLESLKKEKMLKTVRGCVVRRHSSVMTHANFTFSVSRNL